MQVSLRFLNKNGIAGAEQGTVCRPRMRSMSGCGTGIRTDSVRYKHAFTEEKKYAVWIF